MSDLKTLLNSARDRAMKGGLPARRKDGALYALLSGCLFICEKVQRDGLDGELRDAVRVSVDVRGKDNAGKGRRYAETQSDAYILVARYVLEGVDNRNSVYRYATTLREAAKRQIRSTELSEWLTKNGGVRALYLAREVETRSKSTRVLHLNSPITVPKDGEFTVTLRYDGKGFFNVVSCT